MRIDTHQAARIGVGATLLIMLILALAANREQARQEHAQAAQMVSAIAQGTDLYAAYCAECHGSHGQGDIQKDAKTLDNDYMRAQDDRWMYNVIARGRDNTDMSGFHLDESGALNRQQIESIVTMIRYGSWDDIAARVQVLGMVSPEEQALAVATPEPAPDANLPVIAVVLTPVPGPSPEEIGRSLYLEYCGTCHGAQGEGTSDGPALITAGVRDLSRSKLAHVSFDNPDIEGHTAFLEPGQKQSILDYVQAFATSAAVQQNEQDRSQYLEYCGTCHGPQGEGTGDGPALTTAGVRDLSRSKLARVSFDNPDIEGHDAFLTPDQKQAVIRWLERLNTGEY